MFNFYFDLLIFSIAVQIKAVDNSAIKLPQYEKNINAPCKVKLLVKNDFYNLNKFVYYFTLRRTF